MFSSLRIRNFRLYMTGLTVSVAGNWMQNVAVGWLVLQLTDSGTVLGAVTAARFAPLLVLGAWGGLVADRHDKRLLLRITAVVQLVVAAVLGGLTMTHVIDIWSLTGLILVAGVVDVIDTPSRQAFMNNIVGRNRIGNAIALNSVLINGARVVGPGIAGFVIATVGVGPCFLLNAASFAATWLGLQLMRRDELIHTAAEVAAKRQIRAGLRYVLSTPDLRTPLLLVAVAGAFAWEFQVSIPLFTSDTFHGGASEFGWALSAISVGSIAGGLLAARRRLVTQRSVAMSALLWGIAILAASLAPSLPVAYLLLAIVGSGAVTFNAMSKTFLQITSRDQMRGRVMALWSIGWQGTTVLGAPVVGVLGQTLGGRYGLAFGGICCVLVAVPVLLTRPRVTTERSI
ncbi:MAG TPA: MFS transporter [Mycobacteriales bacterium]|nr:MFS transporter [Mycobacteriales bacterium]